MTKATPPPKSYDAASGVGRPTIMTKDVLQKLEDAFMYCFTDEEACLFAGISPRTLYNYQEKNPEFVQRKQQLRLTPNLAAKKELVKGIEGSLDQSRWWASHKMSDDFAPKSKVEMSGRVETADVTIPESEKRIVEEFNRRLREEIAKGHKQP